MSIIATQGIILHRKALGEADRLVTIYTEKLGKIVAKAKAVRREKSKLGGHLEPFVLTDLRLVEGKIFYTIVGAVVKNPYEHIGKTLKSTSSAYYLIEFTSLLTQENDPHPDVFHALVFTLTHVNRGKDGILVSAYLLHLFALIGFRPQLSYCMKCHKKIINGKLWFSYTQGGLFDEEHSMHDSNAIQISTDCVKIMRLAISNFNLIVRLKTDQNTARQLEHIIDIYGMHIVEKEPKSKKFMKEIYAHMD